MLLSTNEQRIILKYQLTDILQRLGIRQGPQILLLTIIQSDAFIIQQLTKFRNKMIRKCPQTEYPNRSGIIQAPQILLLTIILLSYSLVTYNQ